MHNNEVTVVRARMSAAKFAEGCRLGRTVVTGLCAVWATKAIVDGVVIIGQGNPAAITALARVVDAFGLQHVVWAFASMMLGTGWFLERKGKKRAVRELGRLRRQTESGDAYRSSSGLTEDGATPKGTNDGE